MENTKRFINHFLSQNYSKENALSILEGREDLTREEKNFIYLYCFPRPLLDRELAPRVELEHKKRGDPGNRGSLIPNALDVTLILEASRTEQYGRFIKHLMHSFCDESNLFKVSGINTFECPICGKLLSGENLWKVSQFSDPEKEFLAIGSKKSSVILCLDCLIQLNASKDLVEYIDPSFLDWRKK